MEITTSIFVRTIFDMLQKDGFYKIEEETVNVINREIERLEQSENYLKAIEYIKTINLQAEKDIQNQKERIKSEKINRDEKRLIAE